MKIIAISSGLKTPKKNWNTLNTRNMYLNYGLLGLCTILKDNGNDIKMFQGEFEDPDLLIKRIQNNEIINFINADLLLLSLPSYYSVEWAKDICSSLRTFSNIKIYVGGRWVVGEDENWIKSKIPEVDFVLKGMGESYICDCIHNSNYPVYDSSDIEKTKPFDYFNFELLHNFKSYQPCIEVSRGCGKKCSFCVEGNIPLSLLKSPQAVVNEMINTNSQYNGVMNYYFEASHFKPSKQWANEFLSIYEFHKLESKWRCETRVDSIEPEIIEILSKAGLKVLDLGLESASPSQLLSMNKTKDPEKYLNRADALLKSCHEVDVLCKVNVMLYAGESFSSLDVTQKWLSERASLIKGVSVNSLTIYGYDSDISFVEVLGGSCVSIDSLRNNGYSNVDLSSEINSSNLESVITDMSKKYMSIKDYYELKSYTYYPVGYSFEEFISEVKKVDINVLPFKL